MEPEKQIRFPVVVSEISKYAIVLLVIALIVLLCRPLADLLAGGAAFTVTIPTEITDMKEIDVE